MAWANDAWGWNGWLVAVAIPLCLWAFVVVLLALVLRRSSARVSSPVLAPDPAVTDRRSDAGSLGWLPPVPSHH